MANLYESSDANVSHPKHYQSKSGLEVIDAIEAFTEGLEGIEATDTANIIKYACRWKKKNGKQDVEKIIWYATHLLNHLEKDGEPESGTSQFVLSDISTEVRRPSRSEEAIKFMGGTQWLRRTYTLWAE